MLHVIRSSLTNYAKLQTKTIAKNPIISSGLIYTSNKFEHTFNGLYYVYEWPPRYYPGWLGHNLNREPELKDQEFRVRQNLQKKYTVDIVKTKGVQHMADPKPLQRDPSLPRKKLLHTNMYWERDAQLQLYKKQYNDFLNCYRKEMAIKQEKEDELDAARDEKYERDSELHRRLKQMKSIRKQSKAQLIEMLRLRTLQVETKNKNENRLRIKGIIDNIRRIWLRVLEYNSHKLDWKTITAYRYLYDIHRVISLEVIDKLKMARYVKRYTKRQIAHKQNLALKLKWKGIEAQSEMSDNELLGKNLQSKQAQSTQ